MKSSTEYQKVYYIKNKEKILQRHKAYRDSNKDKVREINNSWLSKNENYGKNYRDTHRNQLNDKKKEYLKKRYQSDIEYRMKVLISRSVNSFIGTGKGTSILQNLPYSMYELKTHIENQFEQWMNWNNHGKYNPALWKDDDQSTWTWQLDHIIPHSKLPYSSTNEENFAKCWALDNLRPLSSKQNIADGNRRH